MSTHSQSDPGCSDRPLRFEWDKVDATFVCTPNNVTADLCVEAESSLAALRPLVRCKAVLSFPGQHWLRGPLRQFRYRMLGRCDVHNYDESSICRACVRADFGRIEVKHLIHSGICHIVTAHAS